MLKSYKIEIKPTLEQRIKINQTIGVARFIYNFYIAHNQELYEKKKKFMSGYDFSKWLNNEYLPSNPDKNFIREVSSKATKQSIMNGDKAFKEFFKNKKGFPKFKRKKNQDVKVYFPKNNKTDWILARHKIKIPTLGWIRFKEFGYIPTHSIIKSGTVSQKVDRYYVSILVEEEYTIPQKSINEGIGIDLGVKNFATLSNQQTYRNINKTKKVKQIEKKLKREQKRLSRKYESLKKIKNKEKGEATRQNTNIKEQITKVQKIHHKLNNIRTDYINKIISSIIKQKPNFIVLEDLNVRGMMKNKHLSKAIANQKFYEFREKLIYKSALNNIEVRIVDRFFPSSKTCSNCGEIKKDLKLKDRVYECEQCNHTIDGDFNASLNLRNVKEYKIS